MIIEADDVVEGQLPINKIVHGNALEVLKKFPDESVDLAILDPPYFNVMRTDWKGKKYDWDRWSNRDEYLRFIRHLAIETKRILKPTGSLYIFQDDKNVAYTQIEFERVGFNLENHIVWVKRNNMPIKGWRRFRCFAPITERILFFSKDFRSKNLKDLTREQIELLKPIVEYFKEEKRKIKKIFNFKTNKEFNEFINKITGTKNVASRHYFSYSQFIFPTKEMYLKLQSINDLIGGKEIVFKREYELFKREYESLKREYESLKRYFNQDKNYTDVWDIPIVGGSEVVPHPTQKPLKIIERIIKCSSKEHDIVLDPFLGSGTTALAALKLNRNFVGIEINKTYCEMALKRIKPYLFQQRLDVF